MPTGGRASLIKAITDRIGRTNELAAQMNQTAAGWIGVNTTDVQCLQLLQHGPLTAGDLARATGLTTASMTTVIDRLERAGFVVRRRNASDRRRVVVELQLDRARSEIVPLFMPVIRRWRKVLADYDERDLELLADFLTRIDDALESEVIRLRAEAAKTKRRRPGGDAQ